MYEFLLQHTDILANLITIVAPILFVLTWSHRNLSKRIDKLGDEMKELLEEVKDIDRRLCRIEGALSNKDCCMLKDGRQNQKVE